MTTFLLILAAVVQLGPSSSDSDITRALVPGNTVILSPGVYRPLDLSGIHATADKPAVLQSKVRWGAIVANAPSRGIQVYDCRYLTIDGLCVSNSFGSGIKLIGDHLTVRNCWVTHNGNKTDLSGIEMNSKECSDNTVKISLIEENGAGLGYGHGIYLSGPRNVILANVVRNNGAFGIHLYTGYVGIHQDQNIIVDNWTSGHNARYGVTIWGVDGNYAFPGINMLQGNVIEDGLQLYYGTVTCAGNIILPSAFNPGVPIYNNKCSITGTNFTLLK